MNRSHFYRFLLLQALLFTRFGAQGQYLEISGRIRDAETQLPVRFCSITVLPSASGTVANAKGEFKMILSGQASDLVISMLGYAADTIRVSTLKNHYEIFLSPFRGILNEVVFTGVSKATLIRENPVAITSIPAKVIESSTESNIIDVLVKNTAGLNAVKTGPNISKPFIRGLGYNRVLTLFDGLRQEGQQWGDEHGLEVDAYNIDRAEIIRGPASIMYGSDAVAGVVSLTPAMAA